MAGLAIYVMVTDTAHSEFAGMGMILVTFPWSLLWSLAMNSLGIIAWYERFSGTPALYGLLASLAQLPAALPYTLLLYFLGRRLSPPKVDKQGA